MKIKKLALINKNNIMPIATRILPKSNFMLIKKINGKEEAIAEITTLRG